MSNASKDLSASLREHEQVKTRNTVKRKHEKFWGKYLEISNKTSKPSAITVGANFAKR
jgi:hypothetical protein